MAVTILQAIHEKTGAYDELLLQTFPVAAGESILKGTIAVIGEDGLLYALDSASAPKGRIAVVAYESLDNTSGDDGCISANGDLERCITGYTRGRFKLVCTSITQAMVGNVLYATDNYTVDDAQTAGMPIGTLIEYRSATSGYIDLNAVYNNDGTRTYKGAFTTTPTSGDAGAFSIVNPAGLTILVKELILDIVTPAAGCTIDCGVAATAVTADDLIDGLSIATAGAFSNLTDPGTNGGIVVATATEYITGTITGAGSAALVGTYQLVYQIWT